MSKIRVLVVDDSAFARRLLTDALQKDPDIEVVGTANNGRTAVFKSFVYYPDVITMDIEMPVMNGLDALKEIMEKNPKPVIMMSSLTQHGAEATFKALEYGAVDFIPKPQNLFSMSIENLSEVLVSKVKMCANADVNLRSKSCQLKEKKDYDDNFAVAKQNIEKKAVKEILPENISLKNGFSGKKSDKIVCIGTSTGGPSALISIFKSIPENFPAPILVVQHMPEGFTKAFAERLNTISSISVKEAEDNDVIYSGKAYIAPGHSHIMIEQRGLEHIIRLDKGDKVSGHRPSIDKLFLSASKIFSDAVVAVIMTGMGRDGADGIMSIKKAGGRTIAQNEQTSVVYGMNRVAVESGAIEQIVPLNAITEKIIDFL